MDDFAAAFLLAFPALFSIINPIGAAFIFGDVTSTRPDAERRALARRVGFYSLAVMVVALWGGTYVLAFFGISLAALRIAGGMVVSLFALDLLTGPERREARKQEQAEPAADPDAEDIAFFPLTLPVTTGPGTIATAIALGAGRPGGAPTGDLGYMGGVTAAAVAIALMIWLMNLFSGRLAGLLGSSGSRIVARLTAFLLLAIGIQIIVTGITELVPVLARAAR